MLRKIYLVLNWKEVSSIVRLLLTFAYDNWCDVASDDIPFLKSALSKMQRELLNDE